MDRIQARRKPQRLCVFMCARVFVKKGVREGEGLEGECLGCKVGGR